MRRKEIILVIFLVFASFSCNTDDQWSDVAVQDEELITVGLKLKGELTITEAPMKSNDAENNDIFALQFYDINGSPYAYVVGDDISQIFVDLPKNQSFKVKATYIKDAKEKVYYWDQSGEYGIPFESRNRSGTFLNQVYYTSANEMYPARANVQTVDDMSISYFGNYTEVDRYYGIELNFIPTEENLVLSLELKRMVFGLKLNLTLQEQNVESLRFSINGQYSREYNIPVSEGFAALEIPYITLGVPECTGCAVALDFALVEDYQENISVSIGTIDNHTRFFDGDITVKRNKMMVINHTLEERDTNTGNF